MRTSEQSTNVSGTAWQKTPYIIVDVVWLAYPAIVFLMVTTFLFATILQSRNTPLWKSSALALLHSQDGDEKGRSTNDRKDIAKRIHSRLEIEGKRHRLIDLSEHGQKGAFPNVTSMIRQVQADVGRV